MKQDQESTKSRFCRLQEILCFAYKIMTHEYTDIEIRLSMSPAKKSGTINEQIYSEISFCAYELSNCGLKWPESIINMSYSFFKCFRKRGIASYYEVLVLSTQLSETRISNLGKNTD